MIGRGDVVDVIGALSAASAATEQLFLHMGTALGDAVQLLNQQTGTVEALLSDLQSEQLTRAFARLDWSAAQVARLGAAQDAEARESLALIRSLDRITGRVRRMGQYVQQVLPLAINAKILSADLSGTGLDFSGFADEIARTLRMTRASLADFRSGLDALRARVDAAHAGRDGAAANDAVAAVAARLAAAVASVTRQRESARKAGAMTQQRNQSVCRAVGEAIGALQIGDTTRQRLEHVVAALGLLAETPGVLPPAGDGAGHAADTAGEESVALIVGRLQADQLHETAEQFTQALGSIAASLRNLAADAHALRALGRTAFAVGDGQTSFSAALEAQVADALALFDRVRAARAETVLLVASVTEATESLCRQLGTVQALEADLRIMGLNAGLKCARVGERGAALRLIAQELCRYVDQFSGQASALVGEVRQAADIAAGVAADSEAATRLTAEVEQAMTQASTTLHEKGLILADALARFETDGGRVGTLLEGTAAELGAHGWIGTAMRDGASKLAALTAGAPAPGLPPPPQAIPLLEQIDRSYTMQAERVIHDRVLGRTRARPAAEPAVAAPVLEDLLF